VPGEHPAYVITAPTLEDLAVSIGERLISLEEHTEGFTLAEDFASGLADEVERYNGFARAGRDEDFDRGESPIDRYWNGPAREGNDKNPTMFPLSDAGPYHCIIMGAGTMDTNGGVVVDADARVLDTDGMPIPCLYATGNCIASPVGDGYPGGGITIGTALIFGYLAATNITSEAAR
jgi:succinate dehydrogenase/fumarate reductase flavoprotein subunit